MPEPHEAADAAQIVSQSRVDGVSPDVDASISEDQDIFELVYDGPNVANGTMSARELTDVFTGLTKAFSVVAHDNDLGDQYELRLRDINSASFHIIFEAVAFAKTNPAAAAIGVTSAAFLWSVTKDTVSGAYKVVSDVAKAIDTKKKLKGARLNTASATFTDNEVVLNLEDGSVTLTKQQYELLLSRRIDKPISQIVAPLKHDHINHFQIKRANKELVEVSATQRDYFDYQEVTESTVKEGTEISGTLNSLTKSSRRGTFYSEEGVHVPYKYVGGDDAQLLKGFSAREPVRVRGQIKYDAQGVPSSIEIEEIETIQRNLLG